MKKIIIVITLVLLVIAGLMIVQHIYVNKQIDIVIRKLPGVESWERKSAWYNPISGNLSIKGLKINYGSDIEIFINAITAKGASSGNSHIDAAAVHGFSAIDSYRDTTISIASMSIDNVDYSGLKTMRTRNFKSSYLAGWLASPVGFDKFTLSKFSYKDTGSDTAMTLDNIVFEGPFSVNRLAEKTVITTKNVVFTVNGIDIASFPTIEQVRHYDKDMQEYGEALKLTSPDWGDLDLRYSFADFDPQAILAHAQQYDLDTSNFALGTFDITLMDKGLIDKLFAYVPFLFGMSSGSDFKEKAVNWLREESGQTMEREGALALAAFLENPEKIRIVKSARAGVVLDYYNLYELINSMELMIHPNGGTAAPLILFDPYAGYWDEGDTWDDDWDDEYGDEW